KLVGGRPAGIAEASLGTYPLEATWPSAAVPDDPPAAAVPGDPPDATAVPPRAVVASTAVEPAPAPGPATGGFAVSARPPKLGASAPAGAPDGVAVRRTPATTSSAPTAVDVEVGVGADVDDATAPSARIGPAAASARCAADPAEDAVRPESRGSSAAASPAVNAFVTDVAPPDPEPLRDASRVGAACLSGEGW